MSTNQSARGGTLLVFRQRLSELIERSGVSGSRFAERAGLDRSTLSLLLSPANTRLPRADSIARIAASNGASTDWLLGLSQEAEIKADIVSAPEVAPNADDPSNETLRHWLDEARGQKIRYVPSTLPDQLKTAAVIAHETGRSDTGNAMAEVIQARIAHARSGESEIEVCSSFQALDMFAKGQGIWQKFLARERRRQLEHMAQLLDDFYPAYRWFLFDGRACYATPYTVFGAKRAAVYMGAMYFVFTSTSHVQELTAHFGNLIRQAVVQPNDAASHVRKLVKEVQ